MYLETLLRLTQTMRTYSEYERAIEFAQKVLAADPANERAHQHLMFCYLASGDRSAALRQYEVCARLLDQELAVEPLPETTALYHWIKQAPVERPTTEALITNLPIPVSSFIGREREMAELKTMVKDAPAKDSGGERKHPSSLRLLTLTGPGGSGKTRLAIQVATDLIDAFTDGVWWVELAPLMDGAHVPQALAKTLGVREVPGEPLITTLIAFLRPRDLLLVLDNCEHLIEACAPLAHELLSQCPQLKILATSRETLGIAGEHIFPVPTLAVPRRDSMSLANLVMQFAGIRLFVERAHAVQPNFALTEQNALFVSHICLSLDGIPLALELAAARVKVLSIEEIAARLDDRFNLLTMGSRIAAPRHQTLRAVLDWGYDLLSDPERMLFQQLSVFAGGFTLEAAEHVTSDTRRAKRDENRTSTLDILSRSVDKSLVVVTLQGEKARYSMLETIREFAREKLGATGETAGARDRHFDYFLTMVQQAEPKLFDMDSSMHWVEAEIDNLRAALAWALEPDLSGILPEQRSERGLELLLHVWPLWLYRGYSAEGSEWLNQLLAAHTAPTHARARAFLLATDFARYRGDYTKEAILANQALALARELGDKKQIAGSIMELGLVERDFHRYPQAVSFLNEAISLFQALDENLWVYRTSFQLAETHMANGDLKAAKPLWTQGLDWFRQQGDRGHTAWGLEGLGNIARLEGQLQQAAALYRQSLNLKVEVLDKWHIAFSFEALAQLAATQQQFERAAVLWGAAEQLRATLNMSLDPSRRNIYTSLIPNARDQLGAEAFEAAWAQGRALPLEQAIAFALDNP
jgi:non-specific serine/threonine protein kinase